MAAVLKVGCFPFLNCFASFLLDIIFLPALPLLLHLDPREKIYSPMQDLFCSRKPLTYPGSARVQCGLHGRTHYPLSQALSFFTQTSVSKLLLLLSRYKLIFQTNINVYMFRDEFLVKKMILCNFLLIRFVHYKLCAKIYLFRSSQSVLALIFRCK